MELYLQCGSGFMTLAKRLSAPLCGTTYILSPRDLSEESQIAFAKQILKSGSQVVFDSQLYAPSSDKENFRTYRYWPRGCKTGDENGLLDLLGKLEDLNGALGTRAFVLPAYKIEHISRDAEDRSLRLLRAVIESTHSSGLPRYLTLCLTQNVLLDEVQVNRLVSYAEGWKVEGVYLVTEHPDSDYFVDNPFWMFQLLRLCAGLRIQGKNVILGYANHQMLCMTCAGVEGIAAGNWMNTRSFTFDKFKSDTGDIRRHKLWYYAPTLLTEYSIPYLDVAYASKVLLHLDCRKLVPDSPAARIFSSMVQPSIVAFRQSDSFVHYLLALNAQRLAAEADGTYDGKFRYQLDMLETSGRKLAHLAKYRINGQNRDFAEMIKVNETALHLFDAELGMRMRMLEWQ